jgi:DNA-binding transcriptional ArsR family regulator
MARKKVPPAPTAPTVPHQTIDLTTTDLAPLRHELTLLLSALERYERLAPDNDYRLSGDLLSLWGRARMHALVVEHHLARLGFAPDEVSIGNLGDPVPFLALQRWLMMMREGMSDSWGERLAVGVWEQGQKSPLMPNVTRQLQSLKVYVDDLHKAYPSATDKNKPPPAPATPPLSAPDAAILKILLQANPVTMTVGRIAEKVKLGERTIRTRLKALRAHGIVEEPKPRHGYRLTVTGLTLARDLPSDAGALLLRPAKACR